MGERIAVLTPGPSPDGLAYSDGHIWVSDDYLGEIEKIAWDSFEVMKNLILPLETQTD